MLSIVTVILAFSTVQVLLDFTQALVTTTISPEKDYTVALDPSLVIQFNCTVTDAHLIQWRVDDIPANDNDIASRGVVTTTTTQTGEGVYMSMLFIPADITNHNTSILCRAYDLRSQPISFVDSNMLIFRVQGLLGPPPNTAISESSDRLMRILSWNAPATLDITDADPDILYYAVCYNLTADSLKCVNVSRREFIFPNIGITLLFTVSAINMVGEGIISSVVHKACNNDQGTLSGFKSIHFGSFVSALSSMIILVINIILFDCTDLDQLIMSVSENSVKCRPLFQVEENNLSVTCYIQQVYKLLSWLRTTECN